MGSGRKPAALKALQLAGTFRPDRHAHLVAASRASTAPALAVEAAPAWLFEGLGAAGTRLIADAWAAFTWAPVELALLRAAGRAADDCETATDAKTRAVSARLLAALVAQLRLSEDR